MIIGRIGQATAPVGARAAVAFKDVLAQESGRPAAPEAPRPVAAPTSISAGEFASRVQRAQLQMDHVLRQAQAGRTFSPAELLCLQVRISDAAQVIDFTGKAVDKALGAVKQVLQTQV